MVMVLLVGGGGATSVGGCAAGDPEGVRVATEYLREIIQERESGDGPGSLRLVFHLRFEQNATEEAAVLQVRRRVADGIWGQSRTP